MEFYLQFGHGMMELSNELISKWSGGTVILSPRDLKLAQMEKMSKSLGKTNGNVVIDPQFYLPHSDHERLVSHTFWPQNYTTMAFDQANVNRMLQFLKNDYNDPLNSSFFILPGTKAASINEDWFNYQSLFISGALTLGIQKPIYPTICISSDVLQSEEQVYSLLEYLEAWNDAAGFYLVPEPPDSSYLVEDPNWLMNLLDLCAGIKRLSKKIVVGYANHQFLCLALAKVDAIASGSWLNVRSFNEEKFQIQEDSPSRRSRWYYCPQALSEFQVSFLDIAFRVGALPLLQTDLYYDSPYASMLFSGAQPSTTNYRDGDSHRQYLQCLKVQTNNSVKSTYNDTRHSLRMQIETAMQLVSTLQNSGVRAGARDFSNVGDFTLGAMDAFHQLRGLIQEQNWTR